MVRMALGAARYRLTGHRVPLHAMIAVTHRCNALCSYCAVPLRKVDEMQTHEIVGLLDHLASIGTIRVTLSGGEPLTRPDIDVIVQRCNDLGMWVALESNGYAVPEKLSTISRLQQLTLGLDGRPAHHNLLREPGGHDRVMSAIALGRGQGVDVWTLTVLTKENLGDIEYILDLADKFDFTPAFQILQSGPLFGAAAERHRPDHDACRKALRTLVEALLAGRRLGISEKTLRYLLTWEDFRQSVSLPPHEDLNCMAGQLYCAIDADGTVHPCPLQFGQDGADAATPPAVNFRKVGFDAAFEQLRDNACKACSSSTLTEHNYLYNLNLPTVFSWLRSGRWQGYTIPPMRGAA